MIFIALSTLLFSTLCTSDPCRYEHAGKGVIDITTLGRTDGKAAYADKVPSSETNYSKWILAVYMLLRRCLFVLEYSYNPCKSFSEKPYCENVAACQSQYGNRFTPLF